MNNQEMKISNMDLEVLKRYLDYFDGKIVLIDVTGVIDTIIECDNFYYSNSLDGQELALNSSFQDQRLSIKWDKINYISYESDEPDKEFNDIELFLDGLSIRIWTEE